MGRFDTKPGRASSIPRGVRSNVIKILFAVPVRMTRDRLVALLRDLRRPAKKSDREQVIGIDCTNEDYRSVICFDADRMRWRPDDGPDARAPRQCGRYPPLAIPAPAFLSSIIFVRMHPRVRRDLTLAGQFDHVNSRCHQVTRLCCLKSKTRFDSASETVEQ